MYDMKGKLLDSRMGSSEVMSDAYVVWCHHCREIALIEIVTTLRQFKDL